MNENKADFIAATITVMLVAIIALCWMLDPSVAFIAVAGLALLGVAQFVGGVKRFLLAPAKEKKDGKHEA